MKIAFVQVATDGSEIEDTESAGGGVGGGVVGVTSTCILK